MQVKINNPNNLPTIDYRKLQPLQGDLKDLTDANYDKLKRVLKKRGFTAPVFVWRDGDTLYLMDGHQRQRVMVKEDVNDKGSYEVPFVVIEAKNIKDAKAQLLEITSQYGTITQEGLDQFIAEAELPEGEVLEVVNFDALSFSKKPVEETDAEEDEAPEPEDTAVSLPGVVYQLGNHRVLCGDATSADDMQKLMGDVMADLYLSDPPYNVDYTGKTKEALKIENDKKSDTDFLAFLADAFARVSDHLKAGAAFYIWHADSEGFNFRAACRAVNWDIRQCLIWVKQSMVMGRQDYQWRHEPCLYGWKAGAAHSWFSDRKQTTVLEFDRPSRNADHPTMKPVKLMAYQIQNSTKEGDVVLDTFLVSGSTLMAADQLGRVCYGLELDPRYMDVIRKRWWALQNDGEIEGWEQNTPALEVA